MTHRSDPIATGSARTSLAHLVIAFVTGLPLRSAYALIPHPDDENGAFVGV
jgi:hypothetical protein